MSFGFPCARNPERAERGIEAVRRRNPQEFESDPDTALCDLLTDILHAADACAFEFEHALARARMHHDAEAEGDDLTDAPTFMDSATAHTIAVELINRGRIAHAQDAAGGHCEVVIESPFHPGEHRRGLRLYVGSDDLGVLLAVFGDEQTGHYTDDPNLCALSSGFEDGVNAIADEIETWLDSPLPAYVTKGA